MSEYYCQLYSFVLNIKSWKQSIKSDEHGEIYCKVILAVPWSFYDNVFSSQRLHLFRIGRVRKGVLTILTFWQNTGYSIEQNFCMTILDWVEKYTQSVWNVCRTLKTVCSRRKKCCSEWKQCWRKTMYK